MIVVIDRHSLPPSLKTMFIRLFQGTRRAASGYPPLHHEEPLHTLYTVCPSIEKGEMERILMISDGLLYAAWHDCFISAPGSAHAGDAHHRGSFIGYGTHLM